VNTAKQFETILANVGLKDQRISTAINYASVAQNAIAQVATGNYIGAALAVSGMFGGGKPDPAQQQFAQIMGFLQEMDQKLTRIINLQLRTLEAIEGLSNQVADLDRRLNDRLDTIDFETQVISQNLKDSIWSKYTPCISAFRDRKMRGKANFNDNTLQFATVGELAAYVKEYGANAISCARNLDDLFNSIQAYDIVFEQSDLHQF
jgi:hypothetical protein